MPLAPTGPTPRSLPPVVLATRPVVASVADDQGHVTSSQIPLHDPRPKISKICVNASYWGAVIPVDVRSAVFVYSDGFVARKLDWEIDLGWGVGSVDDGHEPS